METKTHKRLWITGAKARQFEMKIKVAIINVEMLEKKRNKTLTVEGNKDKNFMKETDTGRVRKNKNKRNTEKK